MNQATPTSAKNTLLEEYVGELGPSPAEFAAALGPRRSSATEPPRGAAAEPGLASPNLDMVMRIPVTVKIVLGSTTMPVASLVKLGRAVRDRKGRRAAAGARQDQGCQASEEIRSRGAEAAHAIGRRSATRAHERSGNAGGGIRPDILQWRRLRRNRDGGQEPPVGGD